jgi:protein gp49-like protein
VIADSYNDKFAYDYDRREIYNLTHRQKMLIGQFLADGYMTSQEILDTIERMPFDTEQPLAYLLKCLENLKEERRLEAKIVAHRNAELKYGGAG